MTRDEIISLGVTPEIARAVSDFLKTNIPRPPRFADATALINNEGAMNGWINAADMIGSLAIPKTEETKEPEPMYSEPARK
jgi:hypothetical protein